MSTNGANSLSLNGIVALNDELVALVRAGVPLEAGLLAAAQDYRGRLGQALAGVAGRLEAGEPLPDAVAGAVAGMPPIYRSIVEAGLRSGRLADALQGLSRIGLATIEARRTIALACFYPLLVLVLAYSLLLGFIVAILPRFVELATSFHFENSRIVPILERSGATVASWGAIFPLILVGLAIVWQWTGRSQALGGTGWFGRLIDRLPYVGRIVANYRVSHFADLLGHLVDHEVPLTQAVQLAGDASGNPPLSRTAHRFAERLAEGGANPTSPADPLPAFPPLIAWMLAANHRQGSLAAGLRHLATTYRRKADRQADTFRVVFPSLMLLGVGAVAVLIYGLLLFVPLQGLWNGLANLTD